jgi:Butirosin biosynthesis protein H, N-terminal/Domain of unknown function (DUF4872)
LTNVGRFFVWKIGIAGLSFLVCYDFAATMQVMSRKIGENTMSKLENYKAFVGYYWQSGVIRNALDYQTVKAPHTGEAFSEALLFGVSGGMNFAYFYFHYEGYDPQVNILTRNTFNLFEPVLERLGIPYDVKQTNSADKGRKNLIDALENGDAPIVLADMFQLPYNAMEYQEDNWGMLPIVVYGYDNGTAYIADRARVALTIPSETLDIARARIKKDKHRIITLGVPNEAKLASAVSKGIWDCIKLFTEKPPKGSKNDFGFSAYKRWVDLLTKSGKKGSWAKTLPRGRELYNGLSTIFFFSQLFGKDESCTAERNLFADFLEESAIILKKPVLAEITPTFRQAGEAWRKLGEILLPNDVSLLKETRDLMLRKHSLFLNKGGEVEEEIRTINQRLENMKTESEDFPLSENEVVEHQKQIAEQVMVIHDIEFEAISALQEAMS